MDRLNRMLQAAQGMGMGGGGAPGGVSQSNKPLCWLLAFVIICILLRFTNWYLSLYSSFK